MKDSPHCLWLYKETIKPMNKESELNFKKPINKFNWSKIKLKLKEDKGKDFLNFYVSLKRREFIKLSYLNRSWYQ